MASDSYKSHMTTLTHEQALENIYASLHNDNADIEKYIADLKSLLATTNTNKVTMDPTRLYQSNRQGRKLLQAYFRQRGVIVDFA
jgi:hypothetical protein